MMKDRISKITNKRHYHELVIIRIWYCMACIDYISVQSAAQKVAA